MTWTEPRYSRNKVDQAGRTYVDTNVARDERQIALAIINNWRSSHGFPLNTLQVSLRTRARNVDPESLVAQRIKRLPSIRAKLERFPGMGLSRMQDIGGCRAVVSEVQDVRELTSRYQKGNGKHSLIREDDYIFEKPKSSGYRGVHLVYRYRSDRKSTFNGIKIELQFRSRLQHAWATAVETVGTFTQQALKSSRGEMDWLRFFALMSSEIAHRESTPLIPGTPENYKALLAELRTSAKNLDVLSRLSAYGHTLNFVQHRMAGTGARYFLLELDSVSEKLVGRAYDHVDEATDAYDAIERSSEGDPNVDAVLVSVESLSLLSRAYPNYFLDTTVFLDALQEALDG